MQAAVLLQPFDGGDLAARESGDPRLAGSCGGAIDPYRTCAALSFAASVLGTGEVQFIAQHGEESAIGLGGNRVARAIDKEVECARHGSDPSIYCGARLSACRRLSGGENSRCDTVEFPTMAAPTHSLKDVNHLWNEA